MVTIKDMTFTTSLNLFKILTLPFYRLLSYHHAAAGIVSTHAIGRYLVATALWIKRSKTSPS